MKIRTWIAGSAALFVIMGALLLSTAQKKSVSYDEVIYAPAGLLYWNTGNLAWNAEHPPLQKYISALPWLGLNLTIPSSLDPTVNDAWRAGHLILFYNQLSPKRLIFLMRLPSIALILLLAGLLLWFITSRYGLEAGLVGLSFFVFDPLLIGNGALAMNDIFVTAFFFSSFIMAFCWTENSKKIYLVILSGIFGGLALASKFSGLMLFPALAVTFLVVYRTKRIPGKNLSISYVSIFMISVCILFGFYRFDWDILQSALSKGFSFHSVAEISGFLLKRISPASGWFYFPIAMLIKTPLPQILLLIIGVWIWSRSRDKSKNVIFLIPIVIFWLGVLTSKSHFGIRYLLPALPFFAILVGWSYTQLKNSSERRVVWGLLAWMMLEVFMTHPHHTTYFNQLIGGSSQGPKWLMGSDQDWGQDLPALEAYLKNNGEPAVLLGYWGSNDPHAWNIRYQDVFSPSIISNFKMDELNAVHVEKEILVVSAALKHGPETSDVYRWLDDRRPVALLGNTLFVYDVSNDAGAALELAKIYEMMGRTAYQQRQLARANFLIGKASSK